MDDRDIIVEFIGIPGSGKSSIAAALAARLSTRFNVSLPERGDYRTRKLSRLEKVRLDVMYAPSLLMYRVRRLFHDIGHARPGLWTIAKSWERSRYPSVLLEQVRRAPRQFYILDEWLMHRAIGESIGRFNADFEYPRKFAMCRVRTHRLVYVWVHVDRELACDRILGQEQSFRNFARTKDRRRIGEVLDLWDRELQQLKLEIDKRRLLCIDVDGSDPIESTVERLLSSLVAFRENRQPLQASR